jgi:hypothetical protein
MVFLDNPAVLININAFITKKTCARLFAVSKVMKNYLFLKQYNLLDKLDTSDLTKIKMIINSELEVNFLSFMKTFKMFRYTYAPRTTMIRFHSWNKNHWNLVVTFLIYRYISREYQYDFIENDDPFMFRYSGYIIYELINCIYSNFKTDMSIYEIYNLVKQFDNNRYRELILI